MNALSKQHTRGFTIVELLIVIVVIGILAAITVVAFNGVNQRARDTKRLSDITAIRKALMSHKAVLQTYPAATSGVPGAWDSSADTRNGHVFMTNLITSGYIKTVPVDPINVSLDTDNNTGHQYNYYTYDDMGYLGTIGCATNRGKLAILTVVDLESSTRPAASSPGFSCSGRNFNNEADWVWGDYER